MATPLNPLALLEQAAADESLHPQQFVAPLRAAFQFAFAPNTQRAAADLEPQLFREFLGSQQARDIISRLGIAPADFSGVTLSKATTPDETARRVAAIRAANQSPEIRALRQQLALRAAAGQAPLQTGGLGGGIPPLVPPVQPGAPQQQPVAGNSITLGAANFSPRPVQPNTFGQGTQGMINFSPQAPPRPALTNTIQRGTNSIEAGFGVPIPGLLSATRAGKQARSQGVNVPGFGRPRSPRSQTGLNLFR